MYSCCLASQLRNPAFKSRILAPGILPGMVRRILRYSVVNLTWQKLSASRKNPAPWYYCPTRGNAWAAGRVWGEYVARIKATIIVPEITSQCR